MTPSASSSPEWVQVQTQPDLDHRAFNHSEETARLVVFFFDTCFFFFFLGGS